MLEDVKNKDSDDNTPPKKITRSIVKSSQVKKVKKSAEKEDKLVEEIIQDFEGSRPPTESVAEDDLFQGENIKVDTPVKPKPQKPVVQKAPEAPV